MAIAFKNADNSSISPARIPGDRKHKFARINLDNSYPTGGYAITAANFGLTQLVSLNISGVSNAGNFATWDQTNAKIKMYTAGSGAAAPAEIANATDLSADFLMVEAYGY